MKTTLTTTSTPQQVWSNCLEFIRSNIHPEGYRTWFEPIRPVALEENELVVEVPSQFFYEWLEEHYVDVLRKSITKELGPGAKLHYQVVVETGGDGQPQQTISLPTMAPDSRMQNPPVNFTPKMSNKGVPNPMIAPGLKKITIDPQLNSNYTFDNLIEGEFNRLARTAGVAVANTPGQTSYNPLLIYGGVGLGKTHLLMAIGNEVKRLHPEKVVLYTTAEKFTNQYIESLKNNHVNEFHQLYQLVDVLLVDDIQFFAGKEKTQDHFFHIFNHLHNLNKQIILSSDCPPGELKGVEERLVSRFKWGLNADMQQPDLETRVGILRYKIYKDGIHIPDDVLQYLAHHITSNIRELEGAMISLIAQSSFNRKEVDLDLARTIVKNFVRNSARELSIESIQKIVCDYFSIPVEKLKEKTRKREIVQARQISMHFAKKFTKHSLKSIGLHFGGRDHSTVIHALSTVEDLMATDRTFKNDVENIHKKITQTNS